MMPRSLSALFCAGLLLPLTPGGAFGEGGREIVVARDGTGDFRSIQEAIDSIPAGDTVLTIILIRKGVYAEKIFIRKSRIALVGEDRDSTRIVFAELRENWRRAHGGSDWGSAVVNIDSGITDISLANLTIHNNYGALSGDRNHQFAIRGGGTRVILLCCTVLADGGDTVSLWNREDGMYYHAGCRFEGWVDYLCPRGWCYVTDSRFFGHSRTASIWHDGSRDRDQKLVILRSSFDGVPGFPLGRHHRDGQFYLLECRFSATMADTPIYRPASSPSPSLWGERSYYFDCHREGGDWDWFRDNLQSAESSLSPEDVTPLWTFRGRWDPEEEMPPLLPAVYVLAPRDGEEDVPASRVVLRWIPSRFARSTRLYCGEGENPPLIETTEGRSHVLGPLKRKTVYHWRVDEVTPDGVLAGVLRHFTTQ